jgi:hypothetical protein
MSVDDDLADIQVALNDVQLSESSENASWMRKGGVLFDCAGLEEVATRYGGGTGAPTT